MADQLFASLNGSRVKTCCLTIPLKGCWTADVTIDQSPPTATPTVTLTIAGMSLLGTVVRSGDFLNNGSFRIVGGYGGWMKALKPRYYQADKGVQLGTILYDAGFEAGEKTAILVNRTLGQAYMRQAGPAARVLALMADSWWVGFDGVTQIGQRPTPTIKSAFDVIPEGTKLNLGRIQIATDTPGDWLPGCFFSAPTLSRRQVNTVIHTLTSTKLRTEIWTA